MTTITPTNKVQIPDRLYFRIGDVADILGIKPYVLRYWESEFPMISPQKSNSGQRVYRRSDVETVLMIKHLLYEERYSIEGAKKRIKDLRREGELKGFLKGVKEEMVAAPTVEGTSVADVDGDQPRSPSWPPLPTGQTGSSDRAPLPTEVGGVELSEVDSLEPSASGYLSFSDGVTSQFVPPAQESVVATWVNRDEIFELATELRDISQTPISDLFSF